MMAALLSKLPPPRVADWRPWVVTVCIGMLSESRKKVICVTDARASFRDFSSERLAQKNWPFFHNWVALYAGKDVEYVTPILDRTSEKLYGIRKNKNRLPTPQEIGDALQDSWNKQLDKFIEYQVLRKHKITIRELLTKKKSFTETFYNHLRNRIEQVRLSLTFLACGLDDKGIGHILVVDGGTPPGIYDQTGIFAIGSGANAALSALAFHADKNDLSQFSDLNTSLYCALEARFMAASAQDVGRESTFVTIMEKGQEIKYISDLGVDYIRKIWRRSGAPRIPKLALKVMPNLIHDTSEVVTEEQAIAKFEAVTGNPGYMKRYRKRTQKQNPG